MQGPETGLAFEGGMKMADETGMGAGARGALGAGAAVVVVLLGYFGWSLSQPAPVVETPAAVAEVPKAEEPAAEPTPVAEPEPEPAAPEPAVVAAPEPPRFDVVRVEPDGSATVAGSAAADATVSLRVDGAEVASTKADGQGKFAALFTLPASDAPRLLSLVMVLTDGTEVAAAQTVALAPTKPVAVAEAAPEPEAAPAPEPEAPAAVLLTDEGAQVLQPATDVPPEVLANVSVDTITYTPEGAVQLGGRGQAAAFVRIYLDQAESATVQIGADGLWATTLADIAPGIYTLRVDQIGADGKVTSRFETPFKRETLEALAAASAPAAEPAAAPEPVATEVAVAEPAPAEAPADPTATETADAAPEPAEPVAAAVEPAPAAPTQEPTEAVALSEPAPAPVTITVQPGFTLWGIAAQNLGDGVAYVQVFEANKDKIRDPDLIYPGQVFTIPDAE
jgi:nucleoid-associated protein YgaU